MIYAAWEPSPATTIEGLEVEESLGRKEWAAPGLACLNPP